LPVLDVSERRNHRTCGAPMSSKASTNVPIS
jgi:hypothetical protein